MGRRQTVNLLIISELVRFQPLSVQGWLMRLLLDNVFELWHVFSYDWGVYVEFFSVLDLVFGVDLVAITNFYHLSLFNRGLLDVSILQAVAQYLALDALLVEWFGGELFLGVDYIWYGTRFFFTYNLFSILAVLYLGFVGYHLLLDLGVVGGSQLSTSNLVLVKVMLSWIYGG